MQRRHGRGRKERGANSKLMPLPRDREAPHRKHETGSRAPSGGAFHESRFLCRKFAVFGRSGLRVNASSCSQVAVFCVPPNSPFWCAVTKGGESPQGWDYYTQGARIRRGRAAGRPRRRSVKPPAHPRWPVRTPGILQGMPFPLRLPPCPAPTHTRAPQRLPNTLRWPRSSATVPPPCRHSVPVSDMVSSRRGERVVHGPLGRPGRCARPS